jgi:succinate--hydroxymethylglutarate CoA-transferase
MRDKPLTGIRVLDFTRMFAGPFCTMLLGDLGADVAKIEMPGGDPLRRQGPPFFEGQGMSHYAVNRNKRSVVLDAKTPEGRDIARRLCRQADVIVENFRPGVMARMGLGYGDLSDQQPRLIYAAMSGMGADGPSSDKGAFDLTVQAEGGYMSITGERGGRPIKLGTSAFDLVCGQYAMGAIMTALFERERKGLGQLIETSLLEAEVTFLTDAAMEYLMTGNNRDKWGSEHAALVPYRAFEAADGWLVIAAGHQNLFEAFLGVLGRQDLLEDERFASLDGRVAHRDALHEILDAELLRRPKTELLKSLEAAGVPSAPVNDMAQVFAHPQVLHRGMKRSLEHPSYGRIPTLGPAVKYNGFDIAADWTAPPMLGEHTGEVLRDWLGLSEDELDALVAAEGA